jgi:hypothetical protein
MTKERRIAKARLVSTANDLNAAPRTRIAAARELIEKFGLTARNRRVARSVISQLEGYTSASIGLQRAIRTEVCKLEGLIEGLDEGRISEADDDAETKAPTGIELLPPDHDDTFWDGVVCGKSRRQLLALALGLPAFLPFTRAEAIAAIAARLRCPESMIELGPGRDNPPRQFAWIPTIAVQKQDDSKEIEHGYME